MTVRVLKRAQLDLNDIETWIRTEDPATADEVLADLLDGLELLEAHPNIGPASRDPELAQRGIRYLSRGTFVIFYKHVGKQVRVLRVLRGRRHWRNII